MYDGYIIFMVRGKGVLRYMHVGYMFFLGRVLKEGLRYKYGELHDFL